jgi:hypothetical protein
MLLFTKPLKYITTLTAYSHQKIKKSTQNFMKTPDNELAFRSSMRIPCLLFYEMVTLCVNCAKKHSFISKTFRVQLHYKEI